MITVSDVRFNFSNNRELENGTLFQLVNVNYGGYAVAWNGDINIPEVELWEAGVDYTNGQYELHGAKAVRYRDKILRKILIDLKIDLVNK